MVIWQLVANGLVNGCSYALMAIGFGLIYNTTRVFHIAYGATYTAAAYLCFLFLVKLGWGYPIAIAAALFSTSLLGVLIEALVYEPLARRKASLLVFLLSSLGLYIAVVNLIALLFGNETQVLRAGADVTYKWGPIILTRTQIGQCLSAGVLIPGLLISLKYSSLGRVIRAARDNETLTTLMGINLSFVRYLALGVGSLFAGVAAILSAFDAGVTPQVGMPALLTAAVALIIGGVGRLEGSVVGAFFLGVLQSMVVWKVSARWTDAITFAALILFLIVRPEGLVSTRRRVEEGVA
jgi:branched-chain amino acid transport system permease protein